MTAAIDYTKLIAPIDAVPTWREGMTDAEYHGDKTAIGSGNLRIARDSLYEFHGIMFEGVVVPPTIPMIRGSKMHMALLERERFQRLHVVEPEFKGFTKDGKETTSKNSKDVQAQIAKWEMGLPPDAIRVTDKDLRDMTGVALSLARHPDGMNVFKNMIPERAGYYRDHETGLWLKIKPDLLRKDAVVFADFKTTGKKGGSRPFLWAKQMANQRIDIQLIMYAKGIEAISGVFPKRIIVVVAELVWPYEVAIYYYTRLDLQQAESDYHAALRRIRRAIDDGHWPMRQERLERGRINSAFIDETVQTEEEESYSYAN